MPRFVRLGAFRDFLGRYRTVWRNVWAVRDQLDPPKRDADELAFLPAHLELTETPLSAAPKWSARLIMLFALLALLWACIGQMDIVAVAQGKTAPGGRSKTIQPLETAVVEEIAVGNGQHVKAGQVLVKLAAVGSDSDYTQAEQALQAARLSRLRQQALLSALDKHEPPQLSVEGEEGLPPQALAEAQTLVRNQYQAWLEQDEQLQAVWRGHQAQLREAAAQEQKLSQLTAIEQQRTADFKDLLAKQFISQHAYYEQQSKLIQYRSDLAAQRNRLQQIRESLRETEQQRRLNSQTLRRDTLDALRQAEEQIAQLSAQTGKARQRQQWMTLTSPVDGTVQQLATHTVGGVVTAAQPIMVVVPDEEQMEIEALLPNRDIGFVRAGQPVVVKVEAFPYTRYGYLTGKVKSVSFDAVEHQQLGLVFAVLITLDQDYLVIDGQKVKLTGGMNVSAEIKTGRRRVSDYLISPLQTKVQESLKER